MITINTLPKNQRLKESFFKQLLEINVITEM